MSILKHTTNGQQYNKGNAMGIVVALITVALIAALGFVFWQQSQKDDSTPDTANKTEVNDTSSEKKKTSKSSITGKTEQIKTDDGSVMTMLPAGWIKKTPYAQSDVFLLEHKTETYKSKNIAGNTIEEPATVHIYTVGSDMDGVMTRDVLYETLGTKDIQYGATMYKKANTMTKKVGKNEVKVVTGVGELAADSARTHIITKSNGTVYTIEITEPFTIEDKDIMTIVGELTKK